jgi:hypothetical protein
MKGDEGGGSKDSVSTSELLDLIQADVSDRSYGSATNTDVKRRSSNYNNDNGFYNGRNGKDSFNRVHLTPHSYAQTHSAAHDDEEDDDDTDDNTYGDDEESTVAELLDSYSTTSGISTINQRSANSSNSSNNNKSTKPIRQRMPLDGGYGGMFAPGTGTRNYSASRLQVNGNEDNDDGLISHTDDQSQFDGVSALTHSIIGDDNYTAKSGYSLTSKIFSAAGNRRKSTNNPYSSVGSTTRTISSSASASTGTASVRSSCLANLSLFYLNMPFRLRYFIQLFSIMGVLMIASLNYFIAMEHVPMDSNMNNVNLSTLEKKKFIIGGGISTNKVPILRVRNPLDFLHSRNKLLDRATEKLGQSTRYKGKRIGEQSPFALGWKSMPRQIFNDFETGLSDDKKTIKHVNAVRKNNNQVARLPPKGTVAYVLSLTSCVIPRNNAQNFFPYSPNQPMEDDHFRDFAVMLRSMIHSQSYQNSSSESRYDYKMHAIIHPQAKKCSGTDRSVLLQNLGYHVSITSSPIDKYQLKGFDDVAKEALEADDNDILSDFTRLHAYEMEDYDAVVMVDFDTLVLGSIDEALDLIVDNKDDGTSDGASSSVDAVFSWEHVPLIKHPEAKASVINMSFFVLRPSKKVYNLLLATIKKAPFSATRGWGSTGRGPFPGWMTTQGFLTYFYDEVRNGAKVEMNRCFFGNTAEPSSSILITNGGNVDCNSSPKASNQCNDCSKSAMDEVRVADLSYCHAPWVCGGDTTSSADNLMSGLCRKFTNKWFAGRLQMEDVHPQLQRTIGKLCIDGEYQPMVVAEHR